MNISDLVIREIRARPVVAPLPRTIRTASGDVLDAPLLLIDVLTDAGVVGRAYAFAYTALTLRALAHFVRDIAPDLRSYSGAVCRSASLRDGAKAASWLVIRALNSCGQMCASSRSSAFFVVRNSMPDHQSELSR